MVTTRGSKEARGGRGGGRGRPLNAASSRNSSDDDQTKKRSQNSGRKVPATRGGGLQQTHKTSPQPNGSSQFTKGSGTTKSQRFTPNASPVPANLFLDQSWRATNRAGDSAYMKRMSDLYQTLKKNREQERKECIKNGTLSDPSRPTRLKDAITPVGTCQELCPQFERVERIVQQMVDGSEKTTLEGSDTLVPDEEHMVKRFRRSAAGYDEQLPSDIRPPLVLQKTLDYLIEEVVGGPRPLGKVHKFVWDRTRSIRNDFSIQQVTKLHDVRVAINCFERIARFHLLALHQLSQPGNPDFDHYQEREQLSNTLLSLTYYYNDNRETYTSPNEAEFRAYCTIFEIQDLRPDLDDRAQLWPPTIIDDPQIQTALKLYAAAQHVVYQQGPLNPKAHHPIAQQNSSRFFTLTASNAVSYLMACVCEIYFNQIRSIALDDILKAYKPRGGPTIEDLVLKDMAAFLGFDTEEQAGDYCEDHGFMIGQRADGQKYVDVKGMHNVSDSKHPRTQVFSNNLVEKKRLRRTFPAIINGLSGSQARSQGLLGESTSSLRSSIHNSDNELFVPEISDETSSSSALKPHSLQLEEKPIMAALLNPFSTPPTSTASKNPFSNISAVTGNLNTFAGSHQKFIGQTSASLTSSVENAPSVSTFGKPSGFSTVPTVFGQPSTPTAILKPFESTPQKPIGPFSAISSQSGLPGFVSTLPTTEKSQAQSLFNKPNGPSPTLHTFGQPSAKPAPLSPTLAPSGFVFGKSSLAPATTSPALVQSRPVIANPHKTSETPRLVPSKADVFSDPKSVFEQPSTQINTPSLGLFAGSKSGSSFVFNAPVAPMFNSSARNISTSSSPPITTPEQGSDESSKPQTEFSQLNGPTLPPQTEIDTTPAPKNSSFTSTLAPQSLLEQPPKKEASKPPSSPFQFPQTTTSTQSASQDTPLSTVKPLIPALPSTTSTTKASPVAAGLSSLGPTTLGQFNLPPLQPNQQSQVGEGTHNNSSFKQLPMPTVKITPPSFTSSSPNGQNSPTRVTRFSSGKSIQPSRSTNQSTPPVKPPLFKLGPEYPSPRERVIDKLAETLVREKGGLLDQFMEWTVREAVKDAKLTVQAEQKQAEAKLQQAKVEKYRRIWLSLKYTRKWRDNAWKRSLIRKGKERRKGLLALEKSLREQKREIERQNMRLSQESSQSNGSEFYQVKGKGRESAMLPPPKPITFTSSKRKSFPGDLTDLQPSEEEPNTEHKRKRKREKLSHSVPRTHDRRSHTLGRSSISSCDSSLSVLTTSFNISVSRLSDGRLIDDKIRTQARRLASGLSGLGPTDTTRTEYFKLMSIGIDPNTPVVPRTKALTIIQPESKEVSTTSTTPKTALRMNGTVSPKRKTRDDDDDLETLLAKARKVRETLAEDEHWFREERKKSERKTRRLSEETEKEKRLREWKPSPSRTSIRLEATGAHGLYRKEKIETPVQTPTRGEETRKENTILGGNTLNVQPQAFASFGTEGQGFASLSNGFRPGFGNVSGFAAFSGVPNENATAMKGASADDAIEL
ncbi:MAG: hypothetical protein MMC33_003545 [Icmadophila ericetorum]|nr:hypothetical protein [Icmadophila ericetorum]